MEASVHDLFRDEDISFSRWLSVRRWLLAAMFVLVALCPTGARADTAAQARFHDELARSHYRAGRFEQALREFFLEQRISPNPRIAYNIALCFQELDRNEEAFQYFQEYLASDDADTERRAYSDRTVEELKKSLALVRVESEPRAAIYIDRRELGSYGNTPKLVAVTPGTHQVSVELEGYRTASGTVEARKGEVLELKLTPERILGQLAIDSPVPGKVVVRSPAGESLGEGPLPWQATLPPGNYEVSVRAPDHLPWTGVARVSADELARVTAVPQPAPAETGDITVTSNVPGALVELNGEPVGFSPTIVSGVKIGAHELRVRAPNRVPWSGSVPVHADERSWLTVSLEPPVTVYRSPATWVVGGFAVAALLTGGVLGVFAYENKQDYDEARHDETETEALKERGIALNTAADIALGTGIVAAVAATVLYFTTREERGEASAASISRSKR